MNNKDFFKAMKKEGLEYSEKFTESFPYFCIKIIWDNLSKDEIETALDGLVTNDESIDAFFIDEENREINIIQCKSCENEKKLRAVKKEWLSFLYVIEDKLKNNNFIDKHKNSRIQEIAKEYLIYKDKGYKTKLYFFHLGKKVEHSIKPYESKIDYFDYISIKDEYEEYLSKLDRTEPPSIEINIGFDRIEPNISTHRTLVSIITGDEIIRLREEYRYKLFDKNLRFGLGLNKVNKEIINTASSEPKNFYFFNNGITITSKGFRYRQTNGKLKIEFPQIINGAQTVNAIYSAYKQKENRLGRTNLKESKEEARLSFKDIKVLFRIIQDEEKDGKKTTNFEKKVIRYNNSQNSIKETDFYANNKEQIELQRLFSKFGYFYEIKRGDRKYLDDRNKEVHNLLKISKKEFEFWDYKIDIEKLASFWMAYKIDPSLKSATKSHIFGYANDKYYNKLFKDKELTENDAKEMILAFHLFEIIIEQTGIYGNTIRKGQIISKISQIKEGENKSDDVYKNIKEIINNSLFFGQVVKKETNDKQIFFKEKENILTEVKKYHFFASGRYLTLAIFSLIIKKCDYLESIIESGVFDKEDFIKEKIVSPWLKIILDDLIGKEFENFKKEDGLSARTFYARASTWENIKKELEQLKYAKDKEIKEIFELKF